MNKNLIALLDELDTCLDFEAGSEVHDLALRDKLEALSFYLSSEGFDDLLPDLAKAQLSAALSGTFGVLKSYVLPKVRYRLTQRAQQGESEHFWTYLHPRIRAVSADRFATTHYADAVEAAFKEVNSLLKTRFRDLTGEELDGVALVNRAFSPRSPVIPLADLTTESGRNVQQGCMQMFAGAFAAIRNPTAHANLSFDRVRAIHYLHVASLLLLIFDSRPARA